MDQLVERMLAVGSRLSPVDRTCLVSDRGPVQGHVFAVTLHRQLLTISGEALLVLLIGQHGNGWRTEEVAVPDAKQAHQHRKIALEWRGAEMLVHFMESGEHGAEVFRTHGDHGGKADRR